MISYTDQLAALNASLHLVGLGKIPTIPDSIAHRVVLHNNLPFPAYWTVLSKAMGIIPTFAHEKYFLDRASSNVATSVISGTPLIAKEELFRQYSYITPEMMWLQQENESEIDTWLRVLAMGKEKWHEKKQIILRRRGELMVENRDNVAEYLQEVRSRMRQRVKYS